MMVFQVNPLFLSMACRVIFVSWFGLYLFAIETEKETQFSCVFPGYLQIQWSGNPKPHATIPAVYIFWLTE